ncbi:DMT family transporter [Pseudoroseicyclus aestuarii]|uniref:EamA domain-containing membrane protein RarD n=1 Tax=Pseudoroseicyclus aestuarii TaxID=1795041 RepID=A0A318SVY9_9RHOB|nr:DMT family transporter [Pseudoroseicyclus aestuarii]PYE84516.1 EamA domain-containing membrane protein RarD [Pseudoroseicyclus aestuarii]
MPAPETTPAETAPRRDQPLKGIFLKVLSVCIFVCMASLIKATSGHVPPGQAVFFRSFFAAPVILVWLLMLGQLRHGLETAAPMSHLWRGIVGTTAMAFNFAALGLLPLPEVTAIGYAAPLLVVVLAAMFLAEKVRLFRLSMVALGLVGVMIVLSPRLSLGAGPIQPTEALGAVVALAGAICAALAQVFVRRMTETESTAAIVFWFSITATMLSLLTLPFGWVWPTPAEAAMLVMAGISGGIAQILMTSSYRYADASVIAPFDYVSMLLAIVIGYLVFSEVPTGPMLVGAAIIITAGVLIILRERWLALPRGRARKAMTWNG